MDSRSFASIWFWLVVVGAWSISGRAVLGVPVDVIARARRSPQGEPGLLLLDWLSMTLPRWNVQTNEGAVLMGLGAFAVSSLAILGFVYGLEMAQALLLLALPFMTLFLMRLQLARRLTPVLESARRGETAPADAARTALARIVTHRRMSGCCRFLRLLSPRCGGHGICF